MLTMPDAPPIVFVVDDDISVRESLGCDQERRVAARTFVSAQEFLSRPHPRSCCLVLDVTLPGLSGLSCRRSLPSGDMPNFITGHGDVPRPCKMKVGAVEF